MKIPEEKNITLLLCALSTLLSSIYLLLRCQELNQYVETHQHQIRHASSSSKDITASFENQVGFDVPLFYQLFCMNAQTYYRELIDWLLSHVNDSDMYFMQSLVTSCALSWLLYRAWKTLWTPVPKLINILGIEVPDPPIVSLAGIKADAVTLHWTRPEPHKAVLKYLIQVNGVNVGESSKTETAITVTGLKPSHFYNVRVIAVGPNNFQTGSKVIRLQTYDRYGRPILPNNRLPSSFVPEEIQHGAIVEDNDAAPGVRSHGTAIETAVIPEVPPPMTREQSGGGHSGQRRNTVGRKHSASTSSADHQAAIPHSEPQESMQQLTEKFETIREEIEELNSQSFKEAEEFNAQMAELEKEKTRLRQILKEKEEASEKLKKEVNYAERANRQAQNRRSQAEKELKEKQAEKAKKREDIMKWKKEMENMKKEREAWAKDTKDMKDAHEKKMEELRSVLKQEQDLISHLEEEIRLKGRQIKDMESERKGSPGIGDDEDETRAQDDLDRQRDLEWERKEGTYLKTINDQMLTMESIAANTQKVQQAWGEIIQRQPGSTGPLMMHNGNSSTDFEPSGKQKGRQRRSRNRKSRNGTMSSPSGFYPSIDQSYLSPGMYSETNSTEPPSFVAGPFFDSHSHVPGMLPLSNHLNMSESDLRSMTAGAPLSPTATSLLPSNIFADDDADSPEESSISPFRMPFIYARAYDNDPQSPMSDGSRSASLVSSPHTSTLNLKRFSGNMEAYLDNDRRSNSMNSIGGDYVVGSDSSSGNHIVPARRFDFLNSLRPRGKTTIDDGVPLGTLKAGQSQSFPRQTEESGPPGFRSRRTSFSSGWTNLGFRNRNNPGGEVTEGNGPAPARNAGVARIRRGIFGSALDRDESYPAFDRDPSSPRPASIASSELPRPSTDSARQIWGQDSAPVTWGPAMEATNRNSPLATGWATVAQPWSRNPSRRPSIQHHGSTPAVNLTGGIVSDDDEFLPVPENQSSPPPVGVIGGPRPKSSHRPTPPPITPKLNPAAPTFKTIFSSFSTKPEKEKTKGKNKEKDRDAEIFVSDDISPTASRKSRDNRSIRTQDSQAESHDSFASGLERETSNTTSETNPSGTSLKDKGENSFQKLLRKGSSSKFGFSAKGISWGTANKKGGNGNSSGERIDGYDEDGALSKSWDSGGRESLSVTSSPIIGGGGFGGRGDGGGSGSQRRSINLGSWGSRMVRMGKKDDEGEDGDGEGAGGA